MTALTQRTVGELAGRVAVPAYDRSKLTVGIVHFGVGGFHRAHQAMYLDRLMNEGKAHDWAICGVGVLPGDARMRDALTAQDCLYTLVEKHPDGTYEARVVGSIAAYLFAPDDPEAVIEKMSDPAVRIVSLTITEGGYNIHPVTGEFDAQAAAIRADLRPGAVPATVFGLVTEALRRRSARGLGPFTVMSCDNIPGNGEVARRAFTAYARLVDPGLAAWIEDAVAFPDSMVDRITPVTTDDDRAAVALRSGVEDAWPVVCEPFTQWVLQERFAAGRPPFEEAGVQVVGEVRPYELMKLRLLNADHQALCYFGCLSGYRYVHEAVADPAIAKLLAGYMDLEATPTLPQVPGIDLDAYKRTLLERFANPGIRDTLARLCAESSDRIPKWLLPVVRERLAQGGSVAYAAAVVASWARYAEGVDESGAPIEIVDPLKERLTAAARRQREHPTAFIEDRELFGDLAEDRRFVDPYLRALAALHTKGAKATVRELVGI
ncbi:mannitol dehydrogenase family protein [Nonomuraea glycinis]|uniref:Mannitol-1-phosphate 5-dehydrogenase n=1 Tax=Nonomuraea glycinis TaxID=2047744 RepID=A0A918AEL6_9ACTN|nr:mannitol dehydrogenase family protein [Nonomuraea glycinis]MCA2179793.1 mannitol dehydrogenase family protein [Nonomuraea glycinis]GGP16592.1 mannitol 2-dehydrogenase [Nonomuraea glycinis]